MEHNISKTGIWTGGPWEGFDIVQLQKGSLNINPNLLKNSNQCLTPQSYSIGDYYLSTALVANNKYIFSFEVTNNGRVWIRPYINGGSISFSSPSKTFVNGRERYEIPFTATTQQANSSTATNSFIRIYSANVSGSQGTNPLNGSTVYLHWIKLEAGDKATPWIPNVNDSIYTTYNFTSNESLNIPIEANQFYEY